MGNYESCEKAANKFVFFALLIFSVITTNCYSANTDGYIINGTTQGFGDSVMLFLYDADSFKQLDSAIIINNQFQFKGNIDDVTARVIIKTSDNRNYKVFWLENVKISFLAKFGNFKEAKITGSSIQDEDNLLNAQINSVKKSRDSLNTLLKADTNSESRKAILPLYDKLDSNEKDAYQTFIKSHPASIISAYYLNIYSTSWGREIVQNLYNSLSNSNRQTTYAKETAEYLRLNKNIKVGDRFVDFTERDEMDRIVSLSDFKNKVVLIDFWASWCFGCIERNLELSKIYEQYKDNGFEIFAVSLDGNRQNWIDAILKSNVKWVNVCDLKGKRSEPVLIYGVSAIPDNFLIDRNGIVVSRNIDAESIRIKLDKLLQ